MEELLCVLLDCGYIDWQILDDVGYDLGDIADDLIEEGLKPTLNRIMDGVFRKCQIELQNAIYEAIQTRQEQMTCLEEDGCEEDCEKLQDEINELQCLDVEEDMGWFCNCIDTSCWLENKDVYKKYLNDEIGEIENNMGFEFQ